MRSQVKGDIRLMGKFRIPQRPWDEYDCEANTGQWRQWKTIEILKVVRFQSLNFTSKPKGLNNKIVGKADHTSQKKEKKVRSPKEEVNFLSVKRVKVFKMTVFFSL